PRSLVLRHEPEGVCIQDAVLGTERRDAGEAPGADDDAWGEVYVQREVSAAVRAGLYLVNGLIARTVGDEYPSGASGTQWTTLNGDQGGTDLGQDKHLLRWHSEGLSGRAGRQLFIECEDVLSTRAMIRGHAQRNDLAGRRWPQRAGACKPGTR